MQYEVFNLETDESHGVFDTLSEARGAVAFDRLLGYSIWRGNVQVESVDEAYKRFIRHFPCLICSATRQVEAAHASGSYDLGTRSADESFIPLCAGCHRTGKNSYVNLGPIAFQDFHGRELAAAVLFFNHIWKQQDKRREIPCSIAFSALLGVCRKIGQVSLWEARRRLLVAPFLRRRAI